MKTVAKKKQPDLHFKLLPMKKILLAVDYDPSAQKVAEKGFSLAKTMNTEVILLHVIADDTYYSTLESSPIIGFSDFSSTDFFQVVTSEGLVKAAQYFLD